MTRKIHGRVEKKTIVFWFLHNGPYKLMYLILNISGGAKGYIAISKLTMILSTESSERDHEGDTLGRQSEKQVNKGSACLRWAASSSTFWLETKAWHQPPIRPITDGLGSSSSRLDQDMPHSTCGPINSPVYLQIPNPKGGKKTQGFKTPRPQEDTEFSASMYTLYFAEGLFLSVFSVCLVQVCVSLPPVNSFLQ